MTRGAWGIYPVAAGLLLWPQMAVAQEPGKSMSLTFLLPLLGVLVLFGMRATLSFEDGRDKVLHRFMTCVGLLGVALSVMLFVLAISERGPTRSKPAMPSWNEETQR